MATPSLLSHWLYTRGRQAPAGASPAALARCKRKRPREPGPFSRRGLSLPPVVAAAVGRAEAEADANARLGPVIALGVIGIVTAHHAGRAVDALRCVGFTVIAGR